MENVLKITIYKQTLAVTTNPRGIGPILWKYISFVHYFVIWLEELINDVWGGLYIVHVGTML